MASRSPASPCPSRSSAAPARRARHALQPVPGLDREHPQLWHAGRESAHQRAASASRTVRSPRRDGGVAIQREFSGRHDGPGKHVGDEGAAPHAPAHSLRRSVVRDMDHRVARDAQRARSTAWAAAAGRRQAAIADARLQDAIQLLMRRLPELELAQHEVRQSGRGQRARRLGLVPASIIPAACSKDQSHTITSGHAPGTAKKCPPCASQPCAR